MADPFVQYDTPSPYHRAALAVWVSAGLLFVMSLCCAGTLGMIGAIPIGELKQMDETGDVPPEVWDQLAQAQPYMPVMAVGVALFTMLPAVALVILGFYVRGGRRGAAVAAQVLCWIPLVLVGLHVLVSLPAVVTTGAGGIVGLLPSLALGGVLFWAIRSLRQALRRPAPTAGSPAPRAASPDDDPWEHLL